MSVPRKYEVRIKRSAEKELDRLPSKIVEALVSVILSLETNPRPRGCKRLRGTDGYRILVTIDDHERLVEITAVGHRRDVYRNL